MRSTGDPRNPVLDGRRSEGSRAGGRGAARANRRARPRAPGIADGRCRSLVARAEPPPTRRSPVGARPRAHPAARGRARNVVPLNNLPPAPRSPNPGKASVRAQDLPSDPALPFGAEEGDELRGVLRPSRPATRRRLLDGLVELG